MLDFEREVRRDYDPGEQLRILRHARLPNVKITEGKTERWVKGCDLKHVLSVIRDRNQAFGAELIAKQAQISLRRTWRVLKALQQLSVIAVAKRRNSRGGPLDVFVLVWSELALLCEPETLKLKADHRAQTARPPCPVGATTVPTGRIHRAPVGTLSAQGSAQGSAQRSNDGDDDDELIFLNEKAAFFFQLIGSGDLALRERVFRICKLVRAGAIHADVARDVLRELAEIKHRGRLKNPRALLFKLFANRGFDLDQMIVPVPQALLCVKGSDDGHPLKT